MIINKEYNKTMAIILFLGFAENVPDFPYQCSKTPAVFPVIFILMLLRNLPASARQEVLLLNPEDISKMEKCKIPVWTSYKMFQHQRGARCIPRTAIFQRRASF
jgi:hypothetical protein